MRGAALIAVALALVVGGAVGASAGVGVAPAGTREQHSVKRLQPVRCAKQRPARAHRATGGMRMSRKVPRRAGARRAATRRCEPRRRAQPVPGGRPATPPAPAPGVPVADPAADSGTPADPASDPPASDAPIAPQPAAVPTAPVVSTLGVSAYDIDGFVLRLTRAVVPAGSLTVFFRNHDVSDHNLWIEGPAGDPERISDTVGEDGGGSRTLAVTAGAWRLFCALPDHGVMTRTLTVTP